MKDVVDECRRRLLMNVAVVITLTQRTTAVSWAKHNCR
jgi:hypothetical protein